MLRSSLPGTEERRGLTLTEARVEVRADDAGNERFIGHAAVFDQRTAIGNPLKWGFYEEIAPGAFTKTLSEGDARFLIDHDSYYVVSRVSGDTLVLAQDKVGLAVDSALDTALSYVSDLKANLRNGNVTGMSFGFYVVKDEWFTEDVQTNDGQTATVEVRRVLEVRLVEVSSCTFPAYEQTDAGLRDTVAAAMRSRGAVDAVRRRARFLPELQDLLDGGGQEVDEEDGSTTRKAIASHGTDTDDKAWSGPAAEKNLGDEPSAATLRACYAWVDPDGDATAKSSYKFPHHFVAEDGAVGAASTKACTAGVAALNGARGGTDIPDEDRQGVYDHLARHLRSAGLQPAELKSVVAEPGESTRDDSTTTDVRDDPEPAASTRENEPSVEARMRALAARYHLPAA